MILGHHVHTEFSFGWSLLLGLAYKRQKTLTGNALHHITLHVPFVGLELRIYRPDGYVWF